MGWKKKILEWKDGKDAFLSIVFTWDLPKARECAILLKEQGFSVYAGGPAIAMLPEYLADVANYPVSISPMIQRHNSQATFTSRGCIRKCPFCAVPKIEGELVELDEWPVRPIVCDNNLLACSRKHFDTVIDKLKPLHKIDFNQGLDARLLTKHHAERLSELDCLVRLAFDSVQYEKHFVRAYDLLRSVGFSGRNIQVYVLIGFNDTPEDALYRLEEVWKRGSFPNPMRYQPITTLKKNSYIDKNWTDLELKRYMRYWSRLFWTRVRYGIAFENFEYSPSKAAKR